MNKKKKTKLKTKDLPPMVKTKIPYSTVQEKVDPTFCIICKKVKGTLKITGAKQYPDKYNGKPICAVCNADREMLKETK